MTDQHGLLDMMNIFFSNQMNFWGDVETALCEYDEEAIVDYCKPNREFDYILLGQLQRFKIPLIVSLLL